MWVYRKYSQCAILQLKVTEKNKELPEDLILTLRTIAITILAFKKLRLSYWYIIQYLPFI